MTEIIQVTLNGCSVAFNAKFAKECLIQKDEKYIYAIAVDDIVYNEESTIQRFLMNLIMPGLTLNGAVDWVQFVDLLDPIPMITFMEFLKKYYIPSNDINIGDVRKLFARNLALKIYRLEKLYQYLHYGPYNYVDPNSDHKFLEQTLNHFIRKSFEEDYFEVGTVPSTGHQKTFLPVRADSCSKKITVNSLHHLNNVLKKYINKSGLNYLEKYATTLCISSGSRLFFSKKYNIDHSLHYYFYCYCISIPKINITLDGLKTLIAYNLWTENSDKHYTLVPDFLDDIENYLKLLSIEFTRESGLIHFKNPYYFHGGIDHYIQKIIDTDYEFTIPVSKVQECCSINKSFATKFDGILTLGTITPPFPDSFERYRQRPVIANTLPNFAGSSVIITNDLTKVLIKSHNRDKIVPIRTVNTTIEMGPPKKKVKN